MKNSKLHRGGGGMSRVNEPMKPTGFSRGLLTTVPWKEKKRREA